MKYLTALFVFLLVASASAIQVHERVEDLQSAKDFGVFLLGFAEGIEISTSSHAKACISNTGKTINDFVASYQDISYGFDHKSVSHVGSGLKEMGKALIEIPIIYEECGIHTLISEIKSIASKLEAGAGGVIDVILKEALNIFHNRHDLTGDFKGAISYEKSHNWESFGIEVGKIVGILLKD